MNKRIISIDVGIKNLAYCIIERDGSEFKIIKWDIINILDDKIKDEPGCQNHIKDKLCDKKASFILQNNIHFCNKKTCEKAIAKQYPDMKIKKLKRITVKSTSILELGSILLRKLKDIKEHIVNVDEVIIENQPVLKNPTMKTIQIIIFTWFIEHGYNIDSSIKNIHLFSARDKLKLYNGIIYKKQYPN